MSVGGELQVEQGSPVVPGSDGTPLLLSDQGFDGHHGWLRTRALRKGPLVVGLLVVAVGVWFELYAPLGMLIPCFLFFLGYSLLQNVGVFLDWLRR